MSAHDDFALPESEVREFDPQTLLLIVVGASIEAEVLDRPLAYELCESVRAWQSVAEPLVPLAPIVLTDLWYLNQPPLRLRPAIAIGRPEINAATAYLANRVPTALLLEDTYRIQVDPEFIDLNACVWGTHSAATESALECFVERYLGDYLESIH